MSSYNRIALISLISNFIKVISGPLVILVISKRLTVEEIAYYFSFFSLVGIKQILESGVGIVLKQFLSHESASKGSNKARIKKILLFSIIWFFIIASVLSSILVFSGSWFFADVGVSIDWEMPWYLLILAVFISTLLTPLLIFAEGSQQQMAFQKVTLIGSVTYTLLLIILIFSGFGLYSISYAMIVSNLLLYSLLVYYIYPSLRDIFNVKDVNLDFLNIFKEIWPMLSKVSIGTIGNYFFWNAFNLIALKTQSVEFAGQFALTWALARAGFNISASLNISQSTIYGFLLAKKDFHMVFKRFEKIFGISLLLLCTGFLSFLSINYIVPELFIFDKTLDISYMAYIFLFVFLSAPIIILNDFSRAFKMEGFFIQTIILYVLSPIVFLLIINAEIKYGNLMLIFIPVCLCVYSFSTYYKNIKRKHMSL